MKLVFSEYKSDIANYIYSYVVWAYPDSESPAEMYAAGFLPSKKDLTRWYKTRSVRVSISRFKPSSENRRILRKGENITLRLVTREEFDYNQEIKKFCKMYADIRFGKDVMTYERLDQTFNSKACSHILVFHDQKKEVGYVVLFIDRKKCVHYYYGFYDLDYYAKNLGMYMMTAAVDYFAKHKFEYIYLGTCYTKNALYKIQFKGVEFYNGMTWSKDLKELKYLLERQDENINHHLFEDEEYIKKFM